MRLQDHVLPLYFTLEKETLERAISLINNSYCSTGNKYQNLQSHNLANKDHQLLQSTSKYYISFYPCVLCRYQRSEQCYISIACHKRIGWCPKYLA